MKEEHKTNKQGNLISRKENTRGDSDLAGD